MPLTKAVEGSVGSGVGVGSGVEVGSGVAVSMNELVAQIANTVGEKASVLHNRDAAGGIDRLVADLSKARRLLDYLKPTSQELHWDAMRAVAGSRAAGRSAPTRGR